MKDCLIIGNKNATTAKYVFPLIKDRIISLGYTIPSDYDQPPESERKSLQGLTRWFTTLSVTDKPPLVLTATYDPERHRKYDNYDAINVDTIKDIPYDYPGVMGVPITILEKNLDDVVVIDCKEPALNLKYVKAQYPSRQIMYKGEKCQKTYHQVFIQLEGLLYGEFTEIDREYIKGHRPLLDGKQKYSRALISNRQVKDK